MTTTLIIGLLIPLLGTMLGSAFVFFMKDEMSARLQNELTPHLHIGTDKPEGMRSHLSKTAMLALAVTIHNLPEGMAVGVVVEELIPEASNGQHSNLSTIGFAIGFVLMMVLDVVMG